ncbi:MAG: peptidylprolyl isomerase [Gammaproteobacteria bacterium]|nr:peptidylprolyl isomerase [Gammaproteobacteria bacterium]
MSHPRVVTIHYTLTNDEGEVLDSSEGRDPLSYLEGAQNIIQGLERELTAQQTGAKLKVSIQPADAYGEVQEDLIQPVPRAAFQGVDSVEVGMQFQASGPGGPQIVRVIGLDGDTVVVDANHPLAGQTLHFQVEIVETRAASEEELEHGHVHGPGGHHH